MPLIVPFSGLEPFPAFDSKMLAPPSPVPSLCDSICSTDLEAYLDRLGPLSGFPTPPPQLLKLDLTAPIKSAVMVSVRELEEDDDFDDHCTHAEALAYAAVCPDCTAKAPIEEIAQYLDNAGLPLETVALAYNIVAYSGLVGKPSQGQFDRHDSCVEVEEQPQVCCQPDLLVLSSLYLAMSFLDDRSCPLANWSYGIAEGTFSAGQIGAMNNRILESLEWRLHRFTTPEMLSSAMEMLHWQTTPSEPILTIVPPTPVEEKPLRLDLGQAKLMHGLITPVATPTKEEYSAELKSATLVDIEGKSAAWWTL